MLDDTLRAVFLFRWMLFVTVGNNDVVVVGRVGVNENAVTDDEDKSFCAEQKSRNKEVSAVMVGRRC